MNHKHLLILSLLILPGCQLMKWSVQTTKVTVPTEQLPAFKEALKLADNDIIGEVDNLDGTVTLELVSPIDDATKEAMESFASNFRTYGPYAAIALAAAAFVAAIKRRKTMTPPITEVKKPVEEIKK